MRTNGDLLIFDYPGGQITFHKDLKKYYEVLTRFRAQADEVNKKVGARSDPRTIANTVTSMATKFIQTDVLPSLSTYGIYDMTVSDFLSDNFALNELKKSTNSMSEYEKIIEQGLRSAANQAKADAANMASQEITGLGFGIVSSSIIDHAIYSAQSEAAIEKQTAEAQWKYNKVAASIDNSVQKNIWDMKYENRKKNETIINTTIVIVFEVMADKYCKKLAEIGQINLAACWDGLDEGRSDELLNNIDYIPSKENVIFQAIQSCPYNINAYMLWFEQGIAFQSIHKEILEYFGVTEIVCEKISQKFNHDAKTISGIYYRNQYIISAVSFLRGQTLQHTAHNFLLLDVKRLLALYYTISRCKTEESFLNLLKSEYAAGPVTNYKTYLTTDLALTENIFDYNQIRFCEKECNINIFEILSKGFGKTITSFQDANDIIFDALKKEIAKVEREQEIERVNKLKQDAELKAIAEQNKRESIRRTKKNILCAAVFVLVIVGAVVGQRVVEEVNLSRTYSEAKALADDGEYQKAIVIFRELGDYKDSSEQIEIATEQMKSEQYLQAEALLEQGKYQEAIRLFEDLGEYQDSTERIKFTQYLTAEKLLQDGKYQKAIDAFTELNDYNDAAERAEDIIKQMKSIQYTEAETLLEQGKQQEALEAFHKLGNFSDSAERYMNIWDEVSKKWTGNIRRETIAAGDRYMLAAKKDGTAIASGVNFNGQCNVSKWTDIVAISTEYGHSLGLKNNGTVVAAGDNSDGECSVYDWTDIVAISAGWANSVGLKKDGTVVAVGDNSSGQCNVSDWAGIVDISTDYDHTLGLKSDGTVIATGNNSNGQCDVSSWTDIVAVSAGWSCSVGLKKDGTVVAVGNDEARACNKASWTGVVDISTHYDTIVALKHDGTVLVSDWLDGVLEIPGRKDVVAVINESIGYYGLKNNGTLVLLDGLFTVKGISEWTGIMLP